jgi:DNA-binding transcriptional LysR family regulator
VCQPDGQVDFAIGPRTPRVGPALSSTPLLSDPLTLVCPAGHRLAGARDVAPDDVLEEPVIDLARRWWARALFDGWVQVATAMPAGAPQWEIGVIARDESLRGASGRAFLAAYLDRCRPVTTGQRAASVTT